MEDYKVVFITAAAPALRDIFVAKAAPNFKVITVDLRIDSEDTIAEEMQDADFLVIHQAKKVISPKLIQGAKKLKLIHTTAQGTDNLPLLLASEMGIPVTNGGGANAIAVAEHTLLLMLATWKNLAQSIEAVHQGKSNIELNLKTLRQLSDKTVGIIGFGNIGRGVARMLSGFNANVIFYDSAPVSLSPADNIQAEQVNLETLLSCSDVVSLHVPLFENTRGMIGWNQLILMKPSAILINTSRGPVVDESAMIRALNEGKIAGAGLDVFTDEPPSRNNPLLHMPNVVSTPHVGGHSWELFLLAVNNAWENLLRVCEGKSLNNLTPRIAMVNPK
jgi:phosphoglycerate dehydrogenase-like enzyme